MVGTKELEIQFLFSFFLDRMAGIEEDDELLPSCVEDVRASIDVDNDGDISKEEFVKNALNNKFISRMLKYSKSSNSGNGD